MLLIYAKSPLLDINTFGQSGLNVIINLASLNARSKDLMLQYLIRISYSTCSICIEERENMCIGV
jgi:hypothetical protein